MASKRVRKDPDIGEELKDKWFQSERPADSGADAQLFDVLAMMEDYVPPRVHENIEEDNPNEEAKETSNFEVRETISEEKRLMNNLLKSAKPTRKRRR